MEGKVESLGSQEWQYQDFGSQGFFLHSLLKKWPLLPKARSENSHYLAPKLSQSCSNDIPMSSQISLQVVSKLPPVLSQSCKVVSKLFPMLSKSCLKIVVPGGLQFS